MQLLSLGQLKVMISTEFYITKEQCTWQEVSPRYELVCAASDGPICQMPCRNTHTYDVSLWQHFPPPWKSSMTSFIYYIFKCLVKNSVADPDPRQNKGRIGIRIRIKMMSWIWIRIRINSQMTSQNVRNVSLLLSLYLEARSRIRIRIKVKGRNRIRIKVTSRIRIRIHNTGWNKMKNVVSCVFALAPQHRATD